MAPEEFPELNSYPIVRGFVAEHVSMQFGDVRSMLRLPIPSLGIRHACNFAVAATLCNLISGISVSLFKPPNPVKLNRSGQKVWIGAGEAFNRFLEGLYPWEPNDDKAERAKVLYDLLRNPLAHSLGVQREKHCLTEIERLSVDRGPRQPATGLVEQQLEEIERSPIRPGWLPLGLAVARSKWTISAEGFYRDVFHMLWALVKDADQMNAAESRFSTGVACWRDGHP